MIHCICPDKNVHPPRDNTLKLADLWEKKAGKDGTHLSTQKSRDDGSHGTRSDVSPTTVTVLKSTEVPVHRAPSLGASGKMPPRPTRSNTQDMVETIERKCSESHDSKGTPGMSLRAVASGDNRLQSMASSDFGRRGSDRGSDVMVRKLSSAEVDAKADRAVDAAALSEMKELKVVVEKMTKRVTELEKKIEVMQDNIGEEQ